MKPIDFPEANRTLEAPAGMEATCDPLNVLVADDGSCMSVWEFDVAELAALKVNGGRVCVFVQYGNGTQPPIALTVPAPWEVPKSDVLPITGKLPDAVARIVDAYHAADVETQAAILRALR